VETADQVVPLEFLEAGEEGRIFDVDGERDLVARLEEMGLRQGVHVRMVQPGSPCIVAVNNHRLSFRGETAAVILVKMGG
jgi:Fe2+ transport system protein FeoA